MKEKKKSENEVLEEFPSFHKVFVEGMLPGVCLSSGVMIVFVYFLLEKLFNSLKAEFGPFRVGLVTPDITQFLIYGFLLIIIGIIVLVWKYFHYKSEYEKLQRKVGN